MKKLWLVLFLSGCMPALDTPHKPVPTYDAKVPVLTECQNKKTGTKTLCGVLDTTEFPKNKDRGGHVYYKVTEGQNIPLRTQVVKVPKGTQTTPLK